MGKNKTKVVPFVSSSNFLASWTRTKKWHFWADLSLAFFVLFFLVLWLLVAVTRCRVLPIHKYLLFTYIFSNYCFNNPNCALLVFFAPGSTCIFMAEYVFLMTPGLSTQVDLHPPLCDLISGNSTNGMKDKKEEKSPNPSENQTQDLWITSHQLRKCGHGFISPM